MTVLHHRHYRRSPRYLRSRPPRKMARQQGQCIHMHRSIRLFDCLGKIERRPRVDLSTCQRPVPFLMHRSVTKIRHRRFHPCQTVKLLRDPLRHVSPHRPGAACPASNQRKTRPWFRVRLPRPQDPAGAIQQEQRVKVEVGCAHRTTQRAVTVVFEPDYSPRSTDSSRSRIWIVSDSVSTSLQPSQSTHTYSTQT